MVIRGTPKDVKSYVTIKDDYIIYQLSVKNIFPIYIDNMQAYFNKQDLTLDIINELMTNLKKG